MRKRILALFLIVPLLVNCAGLPGVAPETNRQALAAAELSFQAVVATAQDLIVAGHIQRNSPQARQILRVLSNARTSLDVWQMQVENPIAMEHALGVLQLAQTVLQVMRANLGEPA